MPEWPPYALVEADGYGLGQDNDVERTPLEDGFVRQELRYRGAQITREVSGWLASDRDLELFRAWAREAAHVWFDWTDTESGTTRSVRVRGGAGGIRYTARTVDGARTWDFTLTLEGQY